jgi:uncharacterized membrane protein YccC
MQDKAQDVHGRWYDQIGEMTLALHISRQLPPEIQATIVKNLNNAIDQQRKLRRNDRHAVSVGAGRVLGLYQAARRKRWHDPDPNMHRAFNLMGTLSDGYLAAFADRVIKVGAYLDQQKIYIEHGAADLLADTVDSMLREAAVHVRANDDGIRLVSGERGGGPLILPSRRP